MNAVVDTSVAYKWFAGPEEEGAREAAELLGEHRVGTMTLLAPPLFFVEIASAARHARAMDAHSALLLLRQYEALGIEMRETTSSRLTRALALAFRHNISVYDALFLQLAEELNCPLVTADHRAFAHIEAPVEIRLI